MNTLKKALLALSAATLLLGTACGAGEEAPDEQAPMGEPVIYDASQIAEVIGLDANNYVTTPDGVKCEAAVILTSPQHVAMYADAGDTVATNPAGTAGVKNVSSEKATCQSFFEEKLADLEADHE